MKNGVKSATTPPWPAARIQCGAGQELAGGIAPNLFFIANNWFILHAPIVSLTTGNAQKSNRVGSGNCVSKGEEGAQWGLPSGAKVVPNRETRALASPPATPDFAELAASRVRLGRPCSAQPRPAFGAGSDCPAGERFRRQTRRNLPAVGVSDSEAGADRRPVRQPDNECRAFRCAKGRP